VGDRGAEYVLSVKENQPESYREVKEYFEYVGANWRRIMGG
jgi:hypothetical protein